MAIVQNIDLNLIPDSEAVVVKVNQYDDGTGRINAHLYLNDTAYTPASGATVRIEGTKPDKHGFSYTASISGNTVTANLTTQMTAVAGRTRTQIIVEEPSGKTGTFVFWLDVQESALASDTDISDTEIPAVVDAARQNAAIASAAAESAAASATTAQTAAQGTEGFAEDAEAYAVGKRGGTDVPSTDPTYHNNSKYYAEQAATSETTASNSATSAAADAARVETMANTSEKWAVGQVNGVDVPTTDETYHNNSKFYATKADEAATSAETSADNASDSEQAAKLSEQNAKASEDILDYYVRFTLPRFIIQNNRLYISEAASGEFIVANNRLYIKNPD